MDKKVAFPKQRRVGRSRMWALCSSALDVLLGPPGVSGLTPVSWGREGRPRRFATAAAVLRCWTASRELALQGGRQTAFSSHTREPGRLLGACHWPRARCGSSPGRDPVASTLRTCSQSLAPPRVALADRVRSMKSEARCYSSGLTRRGQEPQVRVWQAVSGGPCRARRRWPCQPSTW